jgi:hypothetical protein
VWGTALTARGARKPTGRLSACSRQAAVSCQRLLRAGLQLAHPFARDAEPVGEVLQRLGPPAAEVVAGGERHPLAGRQGCEDALGIAGRLRAASAERASTARSSGVGEGSSTNSERGRGSLLAPEVGPWDGRRGSRGRRGVEHGPHLRHGEAEGGRDLLVSVQWAFVGWALGIVGKAGEGRFRTFHKEYVPSLFGQWPPCAPRNVYRCRPAARPSPPASTPDAGALSDAQTAEGETWHS